MAEVPASCIAEQIEALLTKAAADRVNVAREEGWRAGWMTGRAEANEEWRARLRALLGDGPEATARPESPLLQHDAHQDAEPDSPADDEPAAHPEAQDRAPVTDAAAQAPRTPPTHAPAAQPASKPDQWRTPERAAVFDREFTAGTDMTKIREIISAMPGPPVPKVNQPFWSWSVGRKLMRDHAPQAAPAAAATRAPAPPPQPALYDVELPDVDPATGKVLATYGEIVAWAANHGLKYDGSNMGDVNRIRERLRQPLLLQDGP